MTIRESIQIDVKGQPINIKVFDSQKLSQSLDGQVINILASGPSITSVDFSHSKLSQPTIFVNGSLSLISQHSFCCIVGYVISDDRFIKHNTKIIENIYSGQPLFITKPVVDALADRLPELIEKYHDSISIIYPVDRPSPTTTNNPSLLKALPLLSKLANKKLSLYNFRDHPDFVIDTSSYPKPIGVSLNIEKGFVEAGTVAFVAAQLAYTLGAKQINLYGVDLINSNQPRFYESTEDAAPCKLDKAIYNRIVPSFNLMKQVYAEHGVQVINKSNVSKELFKNI